VKQDVTKGQVTLARAIAMSADFIQLGLFPLFAEGGMSPVNDVLDFAVCALLTWLLGWHWAFLPGLFAEMVPGLNLAPTWSAAVFFATRGQGAVSGPDDPGPVIDVPGRRVP